MSPRSRSPRNARALQSTPPTKPGVVKPITISSHDKPKRGQPTPSDPHQWGWPTPPSPQRGGSASNTRMSLEKTANADAQPQMEIKVVRAWGGHRGEQTPNRRHSIRVSLTNTPTIPKTT